MPEAPVDPSQVDVTMPEVPTHEPVPAQVEKEKEKKGLVAA